MADTARSDDDELLAERTAAAAEPDWMGDSPHPYEAHPDFEAWCARCPLPREHKVHAAAAGERP